MSSLTKKEQTPNSEEIFKLIDLYFNEKFILYNFQWNAFNQFINDTIRNEITNIEHIIHEDQHGGKIYRYKIIFENVAIKPPVDDNANDEEILFPEDCRTRFLTYASKLIADVSQVQEIIDCESSGNNDSESGTQIVVIAKENKVPIAKIPIMVRSEYCSTNLKKDRPNTECRLDPGCYFIIKGSEKVVIGLERICTNKMLCFTKKDPNFADGVMYTCQVNSQNMNYEAYDGATSNVQIVSVRMKKDNSVILNMTQFADIPIFIIFRALGITTDNDIINYIVSDPSDTDMLNILKISLNKALAENIKDDQGNSKEIKTQDDAFQYLMSKLKNKRYSTTNIETNGHQRRKHLELILSRDFLPHMGTKPDRVTHKAYYLGKMVNKLLNTFMGKTDIDDRDSFINKRVDLPGVLMAQLFRQYFKKMLNDCGKYFKKKNNGNHTNPIDVIKFIKFTTIEQGLTSALLTGTWGSSKRKGVAQMLQRLTYKQFISYFRRIMPPPVDASNSKVTSMRHVNNVQYGFVDLVETPDGHKVGLHKHISLMCSITISMNNTHINNIKNILLSIKNSQSKRPFMTSLTNVPLDMINKKVHINLNGEWLGVCDDPFNLVFELKEKRRTGEINVQTSVNFNIKHRSIDIYTDGGRMIRPLLRVENNKLLLTREMLNNIDSSYNDKNKIIRWVEFIQRYPEVIEYVDVEESENLMIAMYPSEIDDSNQKMMKGENPSEGGRGNPANRYDKVYVKYTHCEFHPMMFMGVISSNIPFSEHNQAPRNYFNFAQTRQGMGIYATNHRYRVDLSYLLYHPMRPLVITRAAKYTHELDSPAGEMMTVAIACYTGYNQEDSIVMNRSSMQRGMCVSTTLKKYSNTITKNTATGQDDIFMKPDRNKVTGMMDLNFYNKLNDKGYVPEETVITNGDVIIGKVAPIQAGSNTNKLYKCESEAYKSTVQGTVDKVYTGIYNSDGYEMYNMRIRSERSPMVGDKLCCYDDSHEVLTTDGWINIKDITLEHKVACLYDENTVIYSKPTEIMSYDYEGPMYNIESNQVSLCVTPNHNMWVRGRDTKYKKELAENIYGKRKYYKKNIEKIKVYKNNNYFVYNEQNQTTHFKINDDIYPINEWLTFFGIWVAEGHISKIGNQIIFAAHKQRVKDSLTEICEKFDLSIHSKSDGKSEEKHIWYTTNKNMANYMIPLSVGAINKSLPEWVWNLTPSLCRILINGMMLGDGHTMENGTERYDTSSIKLANEFQRLCLHAGWACNIMLKYEAGHTATIINGERKGETITSTTNAYRMTIIKTQIEPLVNKTIQNGNQLDKYIDFKGKVYCCTMPHLGVLYVRRNNIPVWCCNSRHGQKGTVGILLPATDMPFTESGIQPDIIINPCCFAGDTLVTLSDQTQKRIDSLNIGDKVMSMNLSTNQFIESNVIAFIDQGIKDVYKLTFDHGTVIKCTSDHKFWSLNRWIEAKDIQLNKDKFVKYIDGTNTNVKLISYEYLGKENVYDIGVDHLDHTFLAENILVHNCIPSRMTIGQLFECVFSKVAALRGEMIDATPFNNFDFTKITSELKDYGFDEYGYEHLYCGMTGKKILAKIFIGPTFYLRLKHMVQDKIHCLTLDHDVLTKQGWKKYNELTMDDDIATLNKDTEKLEYNKPNNILYYENYNGQMYKIKNSNVDLNVTTNHRMLVSKPFGRKCEWLKYDYELAGNIIGKHRRYKKDADWDVPDYQFVLPGLVVNSIEVPDINVDMDAWLAYLGIWIAEGWTNSYTNGGHYTITIASNKQRVKDKLMEVIPRLGHNYKDENNKNVVHSKQIWTYLSQFSLGAPNKFLPEWVMELSKRQSRILIESMVLGDGSYLKANTNKYIYYTTSVKLADQFQQLCLHAGWASNISVHSEAENEVTINGRKVVSGHNVLRLSVMKDKNRPMVNHSHVSSQNVQEEVYDYNGPVFCLEVSNETFYVRRNGIPVWTANSRATGPRQRLTLQPPEGRSKDGGLRFGEMERDAMISHGCSLFLKERLVDTSDIYTCYVCNKCGLIASKQMNKDIYVCHSCNKLPENQGETVYANKIQIPYAFKLLVNELMAINILPRIKVRDDNYANNA